MKTPKTIQKAYLVSSPAEAERMCRALERMLARRYVYPAWHPADSYVVRPDGEVENFIGHVFGPNGELELAEAYAYAAAVADGWRPRKRG
jgi:ABC-type oligopeptide transport system substrate-binding subunit